MTKSRIWKIIAALVVVATLFALCVFAGCTSDVDSETYPEASGTVDGATSESEGGSSSGSAGGQSLTAEDVTDVYVRYKNTETDVAESGVVIEAGETASLEAVPVTSVEGTLKIYTDWVSSDPSVADFLSGGVLVAGTAGEATVTVTVRGTSVSCEFAVSVYEPGTVLKVGVKDDVKGFGYRDPVTGEYSGLEIDLAGMIAYELGYEDVACVSVLPDDREEYLRSEIVDCVVATYTVNDDRKALVDFSPAYYNDYVGVLVGSGYGDGTFTTLERISEYVYPYQGDNASSMPEDYDYEITPCRMGYVADSTALDAFLDFMEDEGILYSTAKTGEFFEYIEFEDYDACEAALKAGDIDIFVADHSILLSHAVKGSYMLEDTLEEAEYAVATRKADSVVSDDDGTGAGETVTELTAAINTLMETWLSEDSGTIADLLDWWIDSASDEVKTPTHSFLKEYIG